MYFAYNHLSVFLQTGSWTTLLFVVMETVVIFFALTRSAPSAVSMNPFDWFVGMMGTGLPLFLQPIGTALSLSFGEGILTLGAIIALISYLSLNRSLGIVAADRGIKTKGIYAHVRHPMYTSYVVLQIGYLLMYFSWFNAGLIALATCCNVARALKEEKFLYANESYTQYLKTVQWRFIPYIY